MQCLLLSRLYDLSYSTAILQDRAWRLWAAEQLVLIAWLPVGQDNRYFVNAHVILHICRSLEKWPLSKRSGDSAHALIPSSPRARLPLANHKFLRGLEGWVQTMCISKWECLVTSAWGNCTHTDFLLQFFIFAIREDVCLWKQDKAQLALSMESHKFINESLQ